MPALPAKQGGGGGGYLFSRQHVSMRILLPGQPGTIRDTKPPCAAIWVHWSTLPGMAGEECDDGYRQWGFAAWSLGGVRARRPTAGRSPLRRTGRFGFVPSYPSREIKKQILRLRSEARRMLPAVGAGGLKMGGPPAGLEKILGRAIARRAPAANQPATIRTS